MLKLIAIKLLLNLVLLGTDCKSCDLSNLLFFNISIQTIPILISTSLISTSPATDIVIVAQFCFLLFFSSEMHHLLFFLLPIATSSKLLNGYICYIFVIQRTKKLRGLQKYIPPKKIKGLHWLGRSSRLYRHSKYTSPFC